MTKLHITHLQATIKSKFRGKIDLSDIENRPENEKGKAFLSRGLAAYALHVLALTDEEIASKAITDTYNDNGIDAIFYDKSNKLLWLVQSKWIQSGNGSPELGDIKKFRDGIRDLIDLNFEKFNNKIQEPIRAQEIVDALSDHEVQLRIVVAFTGDKLSQHAHEDIDELIFELNDPTELAKFISFNLADAHKAIAGSTIGQPIDIDITIANWGLIDCPVQAFYGTISAADIAGWWGKYHRRLFNDNIRSFIGANDVNNSIQETLRSQPEHFWYFNNGITLLCKSISKAPIGGADRSLGIFHCDGLSIVNGAQTVGNIGEVFDKGDDIGNARVLVRLISLNSAPEKFGQQITKAANTQNRIEKRDFVTQDPLQERLALELQLLDRPIRYHYIRSDEVIVQDDSNCTLDEATIALACADPDVDLTVQVKRELGKFWDDIFDNNKPYRRIFNESTNGYKLWRCVYILREVNKYVKPFEKQFSGRQRSLYIHGNRFFLHMLFQLSPDLINYDMTLSESYTQMIELKLEKIIAQTWTIVETDYRDSLVHQIFRNYTKTRDIKQKITGWLPIR